MDEVGELNLEKDLYRYWYMSLPRGTAVMHACQNGGTSAATNAIYVIERIGGNHDLVVRKIKSVQDADLPLNEKLSITGDSNSQIRISAERVTGNSLYDESVALCSSNNSF